MLVPKPKKAFQSPGVQSFGFRVRRHRESLLRSCSRALSHARSELSAERGEDAVRVGDPAEDPALRLDHAQARPRGTPGSTSAQQSPGTMQR